LTDWTAGYVTDMTYIHGYYKELNPALLRYSLLTRGLLPPDGDGPFSYCELGCGQGYSTAIHAAAHGDGQFFATDFNPNHVLTARYLAAGTPGNCQIAAQSFADFRHQDNLPPFDFIALHGVYSWISAENRREIRDFIAAKLKIGGVLYISYNALPGWATLMPLREILFHHAHQGKGPTAPRLDRALAFLHEMQEKKAAYFQEGPRIQRHLQQMLGADRRYLAHEYLNQDLHPMYFSEVAGELAAARLTYAASANLLDHLDAVNLGTVAAQHLQTIEDPYFRETIRDFYVNRQFRTDIYVQGALRLSAREQQGRLLRQRFALVVPETACQMNHTFPVGSMSLQAEIYGPIIAALARGTRSVAELQAVVQAEVQAGPPQGAGQAQITIGNLVEALMVLVGIGYCQPALPEAGEAERRTATARFNAQILDPARSAEDFNFLASPVTGGGVGVSRPQQLFLEARRLGQPPVAFTWEAIQSQGQSLIKDGRLLATVEENLAELGSQWAEFEGQALPLLARLGIA
jgi:SAM-dependent methyltransferase